MDGYPDPGDLGEEPEDVYDDNSNLIKYGKEAWEKMQKASDHYTKTNDDVCKLDGYPLFLSQSCKERLIAAEKYYQDLEHRLYIKLI